MFTEIYNKTLSFTEVLKTTWKIFVQELGTFLVIIGSNITITLVGTGLGLGCLFTLGLVPNLSYLLAPLLVLVFLMWASAQVILGCLVLLFIKSVIEEKPTSIKNLLNKALGKFFPMIMTNLIYILGIVVIAACGVIPFMIFKPLGFLSGILAMIALFAYFTYCTFSSSALIFNDKKNFEALFHSASIVEGNWWKVFGYMLLSSLVFPFSSFGKIASILSLPFIYFIIVMMNVLYLNLQAQKQK